MKLAVVVAVAASAAAVALGTYPLAAQSPARGRGPLLPRMSSGPAIPRQGTSSGSYRLRLTGERVEAILDAQARGLDYIPGEVLVKFKAGTPPAGEARALTALRSRPPLSALQWIGHNVALLRDLSQPDARILAEQLSEQPEVEIAQPNRLRRLPARRAPTALPLQAAVRQPSFTPNDTDYGLLQWNFPLINVPGAWDINHGATATFTAAVVDTGITTADQTLPLRVWTGSAFEDANIPFTVNPDLPASRLVSPYDFVFMDGGPVLDMVGHATHISGTIGESTNNALALAGIAYNVRIMPVKVCVGYWELMFAQGAAGISGFMPPDAGGCPDDAIAAGIQYAADNGAKVINLSIVGPGSDPILRDAITYAVSHGVFVSIAMGNDYENGNPVEYPAADAATIDGAMSVAAIGKSLTRAYYSSTGSYCEIAAPGGSDRDDGGADEGYVWQVTLYYPDQDPSVLVPRFDEYYEIGYEGTSMATPHVAGTAALLMTQGVTSPAAVEHLIEQTAKDLGAAGRDDQFGYGLVQPRTALFGFGIKR
jgi:serine protease